MCVGVGVGVVYESVNKMIPMLMYSFQFLFMYIVSSSIEFLNFDCIKFAKKVH